ncbi:MAG TPA: hypothetical protein DDW65_05520 [Firmicutes bacterium]|nr:hypothetical protein [Bacillota bacterium]
MTPSIPDENIYKQIANFRVGLKLIKNTQVFGVLSFLFCVICMFCILLLHNAIHQDIDPARAGW